MEIRVNRLMEWGRTDVTYSKTAAKDSPGA
jgi:hypothetical protein